MLQIKDVMTNDVAVIPHNASVRDAANTMRNFGVGVLPVGQNGQVKGIITDRDIVVRSVAVGREPSSMTVEEAMTPEVITCRETHSVDKAAEMMKNNQVRRLIIINDDETPVGICSLGDIAVRTDDCELTGTVLEKVSLSD